MQKNSYSISLSDGTSNGITAFLPEQTNEEKPVIVLFPAMGVAVSYYEPFASRLCAKGIIVITADIRGHGLSSQRASAKTDFGYHEIIEIDYPAVLEKVKVLFPINPVYLMGHSLGGQMASLYLSTSKEKIAGLIIVACCSVYYKSWEGFGKIGTFLFTQVFGLIPRILGYFPGKKLGFAGTEAKTQMTDWAYQARTGAYRPKNSSVDYEKALSKLKIPILAISIEGDNFAPEKAVKHLLGKFHPNAEINHLHLSMNDLKVEKANHFSWVKLPGNMIKRISDWI